MKTRLCQALLILFLLAALTGCNDKRVPNFSIESTPLGFSATEVVTAMDAAGNKHTLWSECNGSNTCRLAYARYALSRPEPDSLKYLIPTEGYSYQDPDIAVTDDGTAFGVWKIKLPNLNEYENCYANLSEAGASCTVLHPGGAKAALTGVPRVAARGSTVYSVYELKNGQGTQLYYRRLLPLGESHPVSPAHFTMRNSDADLAISPAGTLHVAWKTYAAETPYTPMIRYADSVGATDLLVHQLQGGSGPVTEPRIVVSEAGMVFIAYGTNNGYPANDAITIMYCLAANCPSEGGVTNVDLSVDQPWNLRGAPAIAAGDGGLDLYGAFAASNSQTQNVSQIFTFNFDIGTDPSQPVALTKTIDYPNDNTNPRLAVMQDTFEGPQGEQVPINIVLTAWRTEAGIQGMGAYDVYLHDTGSISGTTQKIATSPAGTYAPGVDTFDLAANGSLAGGVWIDPSGDRLVPWATMNYSTSVFLPVMQRQ